MGKKLRTWEGVKKVRKVHGARYIQKCGGGKDPLPARTKHGSLRYLKLSGPA